MQLSKFQSVFAALFFAALALPTTPAWAARQYRCFGKVQYRPCEQSSGSPNVTISAIGTVLGGTGLGQPVQEASRTQPEPEARAQPNIEPKTTLATPLYARILKNSFAPASRPPRKARDVPTGTWQGLVEGNGMVHLFLEILRGNKVQETRFMGNVLLKGQPTTFAFVSPLPAGSNWSWRISAIAKSPFQG